MAKKIYAVKKGKEVGLFKSWDECKAQIDGYSGAVYKGFNDEAEAVAFLNKGEPDLKIKSIEDEDLKENEIKVYIDGSNDKETGLYGYGIVFLLNEDSNIERYKTMKGIGLKYKEMRNVAGEIIAAAKATEWAITNGYEKIYIYHDYSGTAEWIEGNWKAKKEGVQRYVKIMNNLKEKIKINFIKVKGHSGNKHNDMADELAGKAISEVIELWNIEY